MIEKLQKKYALSEQGAKDLIKAILACFLQNIAFMLPVSLLTLSLYDMLEGNPLVNRLWTYVIGMIVCILLIFFSTKFQYEASYYTTYIESGTRRITLAERLRLLPLSFFGKKDISDLTSVIMADCESLETAFSHFIPQLISSIASTLCIAISLLFFNWKLALAVLWVLPISFAIIGLSGDFQKKLSQRTMHAKMVCADGIQECIENAQDLKSNSAEKKYLEGLDQKIRNVEKETLRGEYTMAIFVTSAQLILKLGIVTVSIVGSYLLVAKEIPVFVFLVFLLIVSRIYDPLKISLENLAAVLNTRTNIDRMNEILGYPIQKGEKALTNHGVTIEFENVDFSYDKKEKTLSNISFVAKQGEVTAFVGASGSGKTTISRLAARFWEVDGGKILVGGMDIATIDPETLLSLYSIVFQDVMLFNNSVLENIRIGRKDATDEEVIAAAKLANCDEFIMKLPDGYNSFIGENGKELSGGERQRISIARAFLKDSPIILLDEATASLDAENEKLVQTALSRLIENKTVMVIAHRMRTVLNADKIVVLNEGIIIENDTPENLLAYESNFKHMVELQQQSESWAI